MVRVQDGIEKSLIRVHGPYRQTDDRQADLQQQIPERNVVTFG